MLKFRTELEFLRVFVSSRSHYSVKCTKVLSKMINSSLINDGFGNNYFTQTQRISTGRVVQCNKDFPPGEKCGDETLLKNDSSERTVGDLECLKILLKNILEYRNQHINSWLIEKKVNKLCEGYSCLSDAMKNELLEELTQVCVSEHLWLFTQIGKMEKGAGYLVHLREDLINLIAKRKNEKGGCPKLHQLNATLRELLSIWFSHDFLELKRITWKSSSEILQKISNYERVHPVTSLTDLKRRFIPYRRCFVFMHHSLPEEPIIIIHVALTGEITSRLTDILTQDVESASSREPCDGKDEEDPTKIRAAVFYSLSLAQKGLSGIGMSYYLIRCVGQRLQTEFPGITQISTLSPIHQFKTWFLRKLEKIKSGHNDILFPEEIEKLKNYFNHSNYLEQLDKALSSNTWILQETLRDLLQEPLMRLCARYLYLEKTQRGYSIDGAANLHLKNGAVMWRINWRANPYARGLNGSFGIMVNYRYYFDEMEINGKEYQEDKKITASQQVIELVKSAQKLMSNHSVKSKI